jgi:hypothetical protein
MKSPGSGSSQAPDYSNIKPPAEAALLGNKLVPYGQTAPVTGHAYESVLPADNTQISHLGDPTRRLDINGNPAVERPPVGQGDAAGGLGGVVADIANLKKENEALKMMLASKMGTAPEDLWKGGGYDHAQGEGGATGGWGAGNPGGYGAGGSSWGGGGWGGGRGVNT